MFKSFVLTFHYLYLGVDVVGLPLFWGVFWFLSGSSLLLTWPVDVPVTGICRGKGGWRVLEDGLF